jgi:hypothetical protein
MIHDPSRVQIWRIGTFGTLATLATLALTPCGLDIVLDKQAGEQAAGGLQLAFIPQNSPN